MSKVLQLEVVTPDKQVVNDTVDQVICPGVLGEFGVLKGHVALLSALKIGVLRFDKDGKQNFMFISGGFADVNNNVMTVLAEVAEMASDIDKGRAMEAQRRAEERLAKRDENLDVARAESALQRAVVRLRLSA